MLKQETITKIESLLKIKGLSDAIKAEAETDIEIPELSVYDAAELETLKNNEYKNGKEKGVEMAVKDAKEKLSLDFQGKSIDGLLSSYQKKVLEDARIEPAEKVKELNEKVTTLQNTVKEYETKLAEKDNEVVSTKVNSELYKHIPQLGENGPALGQDDVIQLMKLKGYEFKFEEGKIVPYKDGRQMQDKMSNPLQAKDVVDTFMKETKLVTSQPAPSGRGGTSNAPSNKPGSLKELKDQFAAQNKSTLGVEFKQAVDQAVKDNPEFKMSDE